MFKNIVATLFAVVLLSGCSSSVGNRHTTEHNHKATPIEVEFEKAASDRVFFAYNSYTLSEEAKHTLKHQAAWLTQHRTHNLTVEGHCDERGTKEYNIALGERRANSVKHFLVSHGVDGHRIETISYGKERPAVPGSDEAAWAKNRRSVTAIK